MSITDNIMNGLLLLQSPDVKYKLVPFLAWQPVPEFVYRLTYRGFEPLYETEV